MGSELIVDRLAQVRTHLERTCEKLTTPSPEVVDECSGHLESAVRQLAECQPMLAHNAGDPAALEEAWRVRRSYQRARSLIHAAATFHGNWMSLRGSMSNGYTRAGEPAQILHGSRICLQA